MRAIVTSKLKYIWGLFAVFATVVGFVVDWPSFWSLIFPSPSTTAQTQTNAAPVNTGGVTANGSGNLAFNVTGNNNQLTITSPAHSNEPDGAAPSANMSKESIPSARKKVIGIWDIAYCFLGSENTQLCLRGKMSYLANGVYHFQGISVLEARLNGLVKANVEEAVNSAGRWQLNENMLTVQNTDTKSSFQSMKIDGETIISKESLFVLNRAAPALLEGLPRLQDAMVNGQTTQFKILSLNETTMVSQTYDPRGPSEAKPFLVTAIKRPQQF
jgi:hypothetical protein